MCTPFFVPMLYCGQWPFDQFLVWCFVLCDLVPLHYEIACGSVCGGYQNRQRQVQSSLEIKFKIDTTSRDMPKNGRKKDTQEEQLSEIISSLSMMALAMAQGNGGRNGCYQGGGDHSWCINGSQLQKRYFKPCLLARTHHLDYNYDLHQTEAPKKSAWHVVKSSARSKKQQAYIASALNVRLTHLCHVPEAYPKANVSTAAATGTMMK